MLPVRPGNSEIQGKSRPPAFCPAQGSDGVGLKPELYWVYLYVFELFKEVDQFYQGVVNSLLAANLEVIHSDEGMPTPLLIQAHAELVNLI